ncbi:alpha 1,2-mannosyltransferase [Nematocida sp. AWRm80]|nr:alpha 1,2-mannosyltransferase [Nematocida sp. AWRm80]
MNLLIVAFILLIVSRASSKESACILILCRNDDINEIKRTISIFEERYNKRYNYPYVLLNDIEFTEEFKKEFQSTTQSLVEFGVVPKDHWGYPSWINKEIAREKMRQMEKDKVIYGGSESYRHMCRYFSGFFFKHPLTLKYKYYWRIEPGTQLHCDINYDVFEYMSQNKKKYGFVIALHEYSSTIPSLWKAITGFVSLYNTNYTPGKYWQLLSRDNLARFITDEMYTRYNLCHFWSNFEIAEFEVFRGQKYQMYFDFLDRSGGFFYERWGDAPVHSIAISLFLDRSEIHHFSDIGYTHPPFTFCPSLTTQRITKQKCNCDPGHSVETITPQCISLYKAVSLFSELSTPKSRL